MALLERQASETSYRSLASAPQGKGPLSLNKDSKLLSLIRLLGKPLEVPQTESGWLHEQLPHEDTDFLRQARIDLLVPVATDPQSTEVILVLGVKRSEEPYSNEDKDLLVAIAASLAILLERPAPAAEVRRDGFEEARTATGFYFPRLAARVRQDGFEECPQCGVCYESGSACCATGGAQLVPVSLSRLLAQRYRLDQRLGRGGMGTVYRAHDVALDREVAVKLIREELLADGDAAQRFHREAKIAASFSHPAVVTVYDFGIHGDRRAFLVMELLQGRTLRHELNQVKRIPAARSLSLLKQILGALDTAHRRQIVHRDLKPENLFLTSDSGDEVIKILDFGFGKFFGADEARSTVSFETGGATLLGRSSICVLSS